MKTWNEVQSEVLALADSTSLGALLVVTGYDAITRSFMFEEGTIVVSRSSNRDRFRRIKQLAPRSSPRPVALITSE